MTHDETVLRHESETRPAPPSGLVATARVLEYLLLAWRRVWRGTVFSGFVSPLLYLGVMGYGLGSLIDRPGHGTTTLGGVSYVAFIAPGLMAVTAMQTSVGEASYPVLGAIKWQRNYHAMLATPIDTVHVVLGHLAFIVLRAVTGAVVFLVVGAVLGAFISVWAPTAVLAVALLSLAYAAPMYWLSTHAQNDVPFGLVFRLVVIPTFLFAGAFFPTSQLPRAVELVVQVLPAWHGVQLCRDATLGTGTLAGVVVHVGYLLLWAGGGLWLALRGLRRRMVV
ncbi:MAG TPA: ABC transporter permease [Actinomycetales bacterium]|nr:ABC transporter permease [Actinomycetales bacterium]